MHADIVLLDVFAFGIAAAGDKFAVASMTQHQIAAALWTDFLKRDIRHLPSLVESPRGFAIRVASASHELPETPTLEDHHPATIFAILFVGSLRHLRRVQVRQIDRIFLGEGATGGIILFISAAGEERAVLAPFEHQRRPTALALLFCGFLHPLDVFHVLFSVTEVFGELFVELAQRISPLLLAFFDFVQFFFESSGVLEVEDIGKVFYQQVGYDEANLSRNEFSAKLLYILAFLDGGKNCRVGRWTPNAALFQLFDQRCLVVTWRRFGKMLLRLELPESESLANLQGRQLVFQSLIFFVFGLLRFLINFQEAFKFQDRPGDTESKRLIWSFGFNIHAGLIEDRGIHLRGNKALPDQLVNFVFIFLQVFFVFKRMAGH